MAENFDLKDELQFAKSEIVRITAEKLLQENLAREKDSKL